MLASVEIKWHFPIPRHQRVLKLRGDAQQIFVNGEFSGGSSGFWDYTIYVNPYMVVRPEGHYTKHIYVNSQRIASKIGNPEDYAGGDPTVPGSSAGKKVMLEEVVEENFTELFGRIPDIEAAADTTLGMSDGGSGGEPHQYWFTADHLGSSAFVTDASGVAIQHLEYMAFGEVFVDERRTGFGTPYKFNGKELYCESGYYYYGARYYDPRMARFLSVDPLASDMPAWGSYTCTFDNPIRLVDPTGMRPEECPTCPDGVDDGATHGWGGQTFRYNDGAWGTDLPEVTVTAIKGDYAEGSTPSLTSIFLEKLVEEPIDGLLNVSSSIGGHLIDRAGIILAEGLHEGPAFNDKNDLSTPRLRFDFDNPNWIYQEENRESNRHTNEIAIDQVKVLTSIPIGGLYGIPVKFGVNYLFKKSLETGIKENKENKEMP